MTHVAQLVRKFPEVLWAKPDKTLLPKLEFLSSIGLSGIDIAQLSVKLVSNIARNVSVLRELKVPESAVSAYLARRPFVLSLEIEKFSKNVKKVMSLGIHPSCSVIRVLLLKGLITRGEFSFSSSMVYREYFVDRFVVQHQEKVPELLSIFEGKMSLAELGLGFEES
ncbi:hypothetical protein ACLB2K_042084 [Fragaria x ananassa]